MAYTVYIVECADGTLYTGIAADLGQRLDAHNGVKPKGARYTAARRPVVLVYEARFETRSAALKEEIRLKRLTRTEKLDLIATARGKSTASP